jgi:tRNA (guanine-N7-)-methyltransferase
VVHVDPYAHCPRLPEDGAIDPRNLFLDPQGAPLPAGENLAPVELEIGPGRGWFTVERLEHDAETRVIGVEIKRKWATIVDERLKKRRLANRGRIFAEDIKLVLPRFVDASLKVAYLHFPDPWWKKRHEKRLVLGDPLLVELSRVLIPGGELFIQTDVPERASEYEAVVAGCSAFEPWEAEARVSDHPHVARSPRERKAIEDELPVVRLRYRNRGPVAQSK